jgi:hypothetical protein
MNELRAIHGCNYQDRSPKSKLHSSDGGVNRGNSGIGSLSIVYVDEGTTPGRIALVNSLSPIIAPKIASK